MPANQLLKKIIGNGANHITPTLTIGYILNTSGKLEWKTRVRVIGTSRTHEIHDLRDQTGLDIDRPSKLVVPQSDANYPLVTTQSSCVFWKYWP